MALARQQAESVSQEGADDTCVVTTGSLSDGIGPPDLGRGGSLYFRHRMWHAADGTSKDWMTRNNTSALVTCLRLWCVQTRLEGLERQAGLKGPSDLCKMVVESQTTSNFEDALHCRPIIIWMKEAARGRNAEAREHSIKLRDLYRDEIQIGKFVCLMIRSHESDRLGFRPFASLRS